jgi:hypothetical protein
MPQMRFRSPHIACVVGMLLIGWGIVRVAAPAHADLTVPRRPVTVEFDRPTPPPPGLTRAATTTPVRIDMPAIGITAPVVAVAVDDKGALGVPDNPDVVGWWAAGGGLTDPGGALVLDGHVDTAVAGPGALFHLADLTTGDAITLAASDGVVRRFTVTTVRAYPKAELPRDVFEPATTPRLVIITCGGHFNRSTRQYVDNIVAYAEPS